MGRKILFQTHYYALQMFITLQNVFKPPCLLFKNRVDLSTFNVDYMTSKAINRLKAVLAEQGKTNKWLANKLKKNETTVSRWCTNEVQPGLETLAQIADLLTIDIKDLIVSTNKKLNDIR